MPRHSSVPHLHDADTQVKADKALAGASGGFSFFGGKEDKYLTAADLYTQAANAFRMQKMSTYIVAKANLAPTLYLEIWSLTCCPHLADKEAGQAFEKAAQVQTKNLNEPDDAANTYVDAFKVYRQESPQDAVRCLEFAVAQYCKKGNFRRAAQQKESIGEVWENQVGDIKLALQAYEEAAGWYEGDNAGA